MPLPLHANKRKFTPENLQYLKILIFFFFFFNTHCRKCKIFYFIVYNFTQEKEDCFLFTETKRNNYFYTEYFSLSYAIKVFLSSPVEIILIYLRQCLVYFQMFYAIFKSVQFKKYYMMSSSSYTIYRAIQNQPNLFLFYAQFGQVGLGCRIKANCPLTRPKTTGGVPSLGRSF